MNTKKIKTLVIGEDDSVRGLIVAVLEQDGHLNVLQAENGERGIKMVKDHHPKLVIISGLDMPDMRGEELVRQIRLKLPLAKILVLSGYDHESVELIARAAGANDFLHKPFETPELKKMVEFHLAQAAQGG